MAALAIAGTAFAQNVISAKAGLINFTQGTVLVGDKQVAPSKGDFPEMKNGDVLRTEEGLAEVLLTPGVVLRVAENSSFKLIDNRMENIRIELLAGSALVEAADVTKYDSIVLTVGGAAVEFPKKGLFRIDAEPARVRVYDGEVKIAASGQTMTVKEGRSAALGGVLVAEKFDKKEGDAFYRWADRRSGYLALANISAAKSIHDSFRGWNGGWYFNPYYGFFTFIPGNGIYSSPFGYRYYSPRRVDVVYVQPRPVDGWAGGGQDASGWRNSSIRNSADFGGMGRSSAVYSGGPSVSAAPPPAASAPPPAAPPRGADTGTSRGGGSGR
jgi:hypothetical protein